MKKQSDAAPQKMLLVVDDIAINREILKELFQQEFQVLEAENGLEALALLAKHEAAIAGVLLDLVMPQMDGFGVLDAMNRKGLVQTIPVVMITARMTMKKH